jgi:hypothetical protein
MRVVPELSSRRLRLDFSSSGQASRDVTQVVIHGAVFANAVELTQWDDDPIQVIVCESCGIEGCEPGGWLAARTMGTCAVFVPAFDRMLEDEQGRSEYAPPKYVSTDGVPAFMPNVFAKLSALCWGLPALEQLRPLTGRDLVRALQWDAPLRCLGRFPEAPQLVRDAMLAASDGDPKDVSGELASLLASLMKVDAVELRPCEPDERVVSLFLDGPGCPEWPVLARSLGGQVLLMPMPGYVAVVRGGAP